MKYFNYFTIIITLIIIRPFTTFLHEIGHAVPALIFTKETVTIYIGSYGDPEKSLYFRVGRLAFFFKYNPLSWEYGLCVYQSTNLTINKNILITLMGPLTSLVIGALSLYIGLFSNYYEIIKFITIMIAISSFLDFYCNIVPDPEPINLYNGEQTFNDGQSVKQLYLFRKFPEEKYNECIKLYEKQEYDKSGTLLKEIIESGCKHNFIYQLAINSYLQVKKYDEAKRLNDQFFKTYKRQFTSNDYFNSGLIKSFKGDLKDSIKDYTKSLKKDSNNVHSLNNRGYAYNLIGAYKKAINDFNRAIDLDKNYAYALNNRGFAKIKLGNIENGLIDIKASFELDDKNSYCYMNFGIYYYEIKDYNTALDYFNKAQELDKTTYLIEEHISNTKTKLGSGNYTH